MATIIKMPKLSDTMEEGGIASWSVSEGDFIEEGDTLVEIETDKATMEYTAEVEGYVLKILVHPGVSVALQTPICVLGESKDESFDLSQEEAAPSKGTPSAEKEEPKEIPAASMPVENLSAPSGSVDSRVKASPLAKKLAKDQGVDLGSLAGSGPNGRVIARDLQGVAASPVASGNTTTPGAQDVKVPLSMMRKTIAKRLLAGKNNAPHFYLTVSANVNALLDWRKSLNSLKDVVSGSSPKVSVNDLIILAVSRALRQHPDVNSSWHDEYILQHGSVDVSVAVALPGGLVTPILFHADHMGVFDISRKVKELALKAKNGDLKPEEYSGGSFTISNLGMTSVEQFTAIINPPQSCILAVGTTRKLPEFAEDGSVVPVRRMKMTMSCDHRVVDGMIGAKFLDTLVTYLENPLMMLS